MANLVANIELSETVINTLEFTTSRLIFVENAHFRARLSSWYPKIR
jgi:cohesin loading factor subunit SCC2